MINKLNKQYELRLNNKIKMVKVNINDLELNKEYVLNNGYCIMYAKYIGSVNDISLNDDLRIYEFDFLKKDGFIGISKESAMKWIYQIEQVKS